MVWPNGCRPYSETVSEREVRYERREFALCLLQRCFKVVVLPCASSPARLPSKKTYVPSRWEVAGK